MRITAKGEKNKMICGLFVGENNRYENTAFQHLSVRFLCIPHQWGEKQMMMVLSLLSFQ